MKNRLYAFVYERRKEKGSKDRRGRKGNNLRRGEAGGITIFLSRYLPVASLPALASPVSAVTGGILAKKTTKGSDA
jgi:hypothetical protein